MCVYIYIFCVFRQQIIYAACFIESHRHFMSISPYIKPLKIAYRLFVTYDFWIDNVESAWLNKLFNKREFRKHFTQV